MKLGEDVLVEIVDIVRKGISEGIDISDMLRSMELCPQDMDTDFGDSDKIILKKNLDP